MRRGACLFVLPLALVVAVATGKPGVDWNAEAAVSFVKFAGASYCSREAVEKWDCGICDPSLGVADVVFIGSEKTLLAAYVALLTDGSAVVAFRGTDNLKDWLVDLKAGRSEPYPNCDACEVHDGFTQAWGQLRANVTRAVRQVGASKVHITGHSLGASLAVLAAVELGSLGEQLAIGDVVTFGQPRIGNKAFADAYRKLVPQHQRVVHHKDIIPHLPLESMGFWHTSTEIWSNEQATAYVVCDGSGEDPTCSDSVWLTDTSVGDHMDYMGIMLSRSC
mmetsp:Transcript_12506/g.43765  ORF Transcript_12506/g.43765 Transcript_12506/m.43765 type:complete len:278 (-) Transcript_12506:96-929(-)